MYIIVIDAILSFSLLYQLKLRANYLQILLEYSLAILCLIKGYFKLRRARYKAISLALANRLATAYSQQFISYICYLAQLERKSLQVKVKYILDDRLLFSCSKLLAVRGSFCAKGQSLGAIRKRAASNVKGLSSSLVALKLTRFIGFKSKLQPLFMFK